MRAYPGTTFDWWAGINDEAMLATAIALATREE